MRISDFLSTTFRSLVRHKLRTALTALGVVIGVCSILVMISIGIGLNETFANQFANDPFFLQINVHKYGSDRNIKIDDAAIKKFRAIPGVNTVTPKWYSHDIRFNIKTDDDRYQTEYITIIGIYSDSLENLGYKIADGRGFKKGDKPYSMIVGRNFAYNFIDTRKTGKNRKRYPYSWDGSEVKPPFLSNNDLLKKNFTLFAPHPKKDPENENEKVRYVEFKPNIIGVLAEKDGDYEYENAIIMDIQDLKNLMEKYYRETGSKKKLNLTYDDVTVYCKTIDDVESVVAAIKDMGYGTSSMQDMREEIQKFTTTLNLILGGLAGISLFVAAIGIANTMVMSVIERTREIGIMKVIGAKLGTIRTIFLMEAGMIGLIGGSIGVIFSCIISVIINVYAAQLQEMSKISIMPPWLILFALVFSVLIGLIFGFLPANKAVSVSALEAIKHD